MTGVSIEATLELWASSLRDAKARMRPLFTLERVANSASQFLDDSLGEEWRKTGWMRGKASCGVGRQYTGSAGKITNCQIGVFASYVSPMVMPSSIGHSIRRRPDGGLEPGARAHVPDTVSFLTKPALALAMIERAIASDVPFAWVAADSVCGGDIEMALKRAARAIVLGVNANHLFRSWDKPLAVARTAKDIAEEPDDAWRRLSAGEGTKGARRHDWV
ncbi:MULTISPECIES: transposase [Rhizobium]|uniref:SRSO17 transposase n=1 Tax=Rhizobium esperanzae TaxID=1967781 RepID=A0A7W6URB8_9HYPH|nr:MULTISPECIES: transposase [Rhizobium]MBB4442174.1 SRSO17 transposase [Rhizobium esperanzae]MDH6204884.1 SRSO17 transposase [Rhizobium leguminosarum]